MEKTSSLYIHIPFCISKCAYCDFFSRAQGEKASSVQSPVPDSYIQALIKEITFRLSSNGLSQLKTIYIGGGTPSLLSSEQFLLLFNSMKKLVKLDGAEITVEVNPDDVSLDLLQVLEACGVNRISCGIQSMNNEALKLACRRADAETNRKALSLLRDYWPGTLSLDLISALPGDDEENLLLSLQEVCRAKADHISFYSLTIEEETPFGKMLATGELNYDFDRADKLWLLGRDFLEKEGYEWYEVSNFCLKGKECRHNLVYWTHGAYLGCGSGATGTIYYEDGRGFRWTNSQNIEEYINYWTGQGKESVKRAERDEEIDLETSKFEFFMMSLRKSSGFTEKEYQKAFAEKLPEKFTSLFDSWQKRGLCKKETEEKDGEVRYEMSRQGMLFLNRFLEELV